MEIVNVRIDERLVHGMVAGYWLPSLNVNRVICIDEESANNPMKKSALRMATPTNIFLSVIPVQKAIENITNQKYKNEKIMIIAKTPDILLTLKNSGVPFDSITIGNLNVIKKQEQDIQINNFVNVNQKDIQSFEDLHKHNVSLVMQLTPNDRPYDFYTLLKERIG